MSVVWLVVVLTTRSSTTWSIFSRTSSTLPTPRRPSTSANVFSQGPPKTRIYAIYCRIANSRFRNPFRYPYIPENFFYHPRMWTVLRSVASVCHVRALIFESLNLEISFLVRIFRISRSGSYVKVIGSRSRSMSHESQRYTSVSEYTHLRVVRCH